MQRLIDDFIADSSLSFCFYFVPETMSRARHIHGEVNEARRAANLELEEARRAAILEMEEDFADQWGRVNLAWHIYSREMRALQGPDVPVRPVSMWSGGWMWPSKYHHAAAA